jgi:hypothetical protein
MEDRAGALAGAGRIACTATSAQMPQRLAHMDTINRGISDESVPTGMQCSRLRTMSLAARPVNPFGGTVDVAILRSAARDAGANREPAIDRNFGHPRHMRGVQTCGMGCSTPSAIGCEANNRQGRLVDNPPTSACNPVDSCGPFANLPV